MAQALVSNIDSSKVAAALRSGYKIYLHNIRCNIHVHNVHVHKCFLFVVYFCFL